MLTFVLASFLAAPPAGEPCPVVLRPAVVVKAEEPPTVDAPEAEESRASTDQDAPRLAPARTVPPKAKLRPRKKR